MVKNLTLILSCGLLLSSFLGCTRAAPEGSSRVVFAIPQNSKSSDLSALEGSEPASLDEINCFYVVVAGIEPFMSNLRCGRVNPDNTLQLVLKGGLIIGGTKRSEGSIEAFVPSGYNRQFHLLGMKRPLSDDCKLVGDALNFEPSGTQIIPTRSNLYWLGSSSTMDLKPGTSGTVVPISMSFDESAWINACRRTEVSPIVINPAAPATRLKLDKAAFPFFNYTKANSCQPFEFELRNSLSKPAAHTEDLEVKVRTADTQNDVTTVTAAKTYSSFTQCTNDSGGVTEFIIPQGTTQVVRWLITSTQTVSYVRMTTDAEGITTSHFSDSSQALSALRNAASPSTQMSYEISGPRLTGGSFGCYRYHIGIKTYDNAPISLSTYPYRFSNNTNIYKVYDDDTCTNEITSATALTSSEVYIRSLRTEGQDRTQIVISAAPPGSSSLSLGVKETHSLGTTIATHVAIDGPRVIEHNTCQLMTVNFQNTLGAAVPAPSTQTITLTTSAGSLLSTDACSTMNNSATVTLNAGDSSGKFYLKAITTPPVTATIVPAASGFTPLPASILFELF